jgi:hypothetical protein
MAQPIQITAILPPSMQEMQGYDEYYHPINELLKKFAHLTSYTRNASGFGGSEMPDIVLGKTKFRTLDEMIINKARGISNTSMHTQWGHIMEDTVKFYIGALYGIVIVELPLSIPSQHERLFYSGDGASMLMFNGKPIRVLLEIKSPFERTPDGTVPKDYLPQVLTGLGHIELDPVFDMAMFLDAVQRVCLITDFGRPGAYSQVFHIETSYASKFGRKKIMPTYTHEVDYGLIGMYLPTGASLETKGELAAIMREFYTDAESYYLGGQVKDLVFESVITISRIFMMTNKNKPPVERVTPYYLPTMMQLARAGEKEFDTIELIGRFKDKCDNEGWTLVGVLPYKLMSVSIVLVNKPKINFITQHWQKIDEAAQRLDALLKEVTPHH